MIGIVRDGVADRCSNLVMGRVGKADIQDGVGVVLRHFCSPFYVFQNIRLDQLALAENPNAGTIAVE